MFLSFRMEPDVTATRSVIRFGVSLFRDLCS